MPTVPRLTGTQVESAPLPGVRRQSAETALSRGAGLFDAQAQTHEAEAGLFQNLAQVSEHEAASIYQEQRKRALDASLLDASNQLSDWEKTNLYDPKTGALAVKGRNALDLPDKLTPSFEKLAGTLEAKLDPAARPAFQQLRARRAENIDHVLSSHVLGEMQAVESQGQIDGINNARDAAVANANDPVRIAQELDNGTKILKTRAQQQGYDAATAEKQLLEFTTAVHGGIVARLLDEDQAPRARAYFDATKGQIAGSQLGQLEKALDIGNVRDQARAAVTNILAQRDDNGQPLSLTAQLEQAGRLKDDNVAEEVKQRLRQNQADVERQQRVDEERDLNDAYNILDQNGGDVSRIPTDQWRRLGPHQPALRDAGLHIAKGDPIQTDWGVYYDLMRTVTDDPAAFDKANLATYRPNLGDGEFKQLVDLQLAVRQGGQRALDAVRTATIDDDLFKTAALSAGLPAYSEPSQLKADDRERLGRLRNAVEEAIAHDQVGKKQPLTREEKATVMQRVLDQHVMLDVWGRDTTRPAAAVINSERESAYVPIANIPQANLTEFANYVRSVSPKTLKLSDQAITAQYSDRFQRAYAALVMKLGDAEVIRRLEGK